MPRSISNETFSAVMRSTIGWNQWEPTKIAESLSMPIDEFDRKLRDEQVFSEHERQTLTDLLDLGPILFDLSLEPWDRDGKGE